MNFRLIAVYGAFEALLLVVEAVGRHEAGQGVEFAQGFGGFDGGEGL